MVKRASSVRTATIAATSAACQASTRRRTSARSVAARQHRQAHVGGDAIEPGAERGARLEALELSPGPEERLLERVVGIVERAEHPVAMDVELALERPRQLPERAFIPRPRRG